jgi:hypothetical protein
MFREMRTAPLNTADLLSRPQRQAKELRLKVVGLNVVELALAACGLALAAVVCFVLAALGAYAASVDLPAYLQAALIVFGPITGIWLALVLGAKVTVNKRAHDRRPAALAISGSSAQRHSDAASRRGENSRNPASTRG